MKYFFLFSLLFICILSVGQGSEENLPKPVSKSLKKMFGNEKLVLAEEQQARQNLTSDKFFTILTEKDKKTKGYLHYGRVKTCRAGGCDAPGAQSGNHDSEYFDYFIIFDSEFKVQTVTIFNYQASYGHEITARGWLKQFHGFTGEDSLEVGKDIDAISGATVSVHAITDDIQWKTKLLQEINQ